MVSSYASLKHQLATMGDVRLSEQIADKSVLSYDKEGDVWVNKPAGDLGLSTKNISIVTSDWIDSGTTYTISIPQAMHEQGSTVFVKTFEGATSLTEVFVGWSSDLEGNILLSIVKTPDARFSGIVSICKLLLV